MEKSKSELRKEKFKELLIGFEGMSDIDWGLFKHLVDRYYSSKSKEIKFENSELVENLIDQVIP